MSGVNLGGIIPASIADLPNLQSIKSNEMPILTVHVDSSNTVSSAPSGSTSSAPVSTPDQQSSSPSIVLIACVSAGVIVLLIIIIYLLCLCKKKPQNPEKPENTSFSVNSVTHVDGYSLQQHVPVETPPPNLNTFLSRSASDVQSVDTVQPAAPPSTTKPKNYITKDNSNVSVDSANELRKLAKDHSGVSSTNQRLLMRDHSGISATSEQQRLAKDHSSVSTITDERKISKHHSGLSALSNEKETAPTMNEPRYISPPFTDKPNVYKEYDIQSQTSNPVYATSETALSDIYSSEYESQHGEYI
ncbi:hypothetical protein HDV01_001328 [Terramyces sp. JEL0728]|nr:hypothetical protein HDV01_001328 [Terramyces sp. JEL0728]